MVKLIIYNEQYKQQLESILKDMSVELFGKGTANIDEFVNNHWVIYLALEDDEVIGLSSYFYNTYYGLRPPTVGNTYLYVKPEYRRGRASYLLSIQSAYVSVDMDLPLETYYASDASRSIGKKRMPDGKHLCDVWEYTPEELSQAYNKSTKNFKARKDK